MNSGITRWKMVPSYSGTPCFLACVTGSVQSLVPVASPIKFATPIGAFFGNRVQFILPAVVSMTAIGSGVSSAPAAAGVRRGAVGGECLGCDHTDRDNRPTMIASPNILRMWTPCEIKVIGPSGRFELNKNCTTAAHNLRADNPGSRSGQCASALTDCIFALM